MCRLSARRLGDIYAVPGACADCLPAGEEFNVGGLKSEPKVFGQWISQYIKGSLVGNPCCESARPKYYVQSLGPVVSLMSDFFIITFVDPLGFLLFLGAEDLLENASHIAILLSLRFNSKSASLQTNTSHTADRLYLVFGTSTPTDENALYPRNSTQETLALSSDPVLVDKSNSISNFSLSASSSATDLLDSSITSASGEFGEPIPIDFVVQLLPIDRRRVNPQAFYSLMMQALSQFAMCDYESQTDPSCFHDPEPSYNGYAMTVFGLSSSAPRRLTPIKIKFALWGLLRVLERISGLEQWTAVKAEFYIGGRVCGGMYFLDTESLGGRNNVAVGGSSSPLTTLILASDRRISSSDNSSKELAPISPMASDDILWRSLASLTSSSSSSLNDRFGRLELIPHYGPFPLTPRQIMVSYARALATEGLAIPPKSDQPSPSIKFDQQDLQTSIFFDRAAPMAALPVWTYEWIITAISHVVNETWTVLDQGLHSCVYNVKVDEILLGYIGIGPLW